LGNPARGQVKAPLDSSGSDGKTSTAAPEMWPERSASARASKGVEVDDAAPSVVDQVGAGTHQGQLVPPDQVLGERGRRNVDRDDVARGQQVLERGSGDGVSHRKLGGDVVVLHPKTEGLGQHRDLRADVAVSDDAKRAPADLVGPGGALVPGPGVQGGALVAEPPRQGDDLGDGEFGDASGVREGGVEDRDPAATGGPQIDLIGADAEAAHGQKTRRCGEKFGIEAGLGADADDVGAAERLAQGLARQGVAVPLDRKAESAKGLFSGGMDVLEENGVKWRGGHAKWEVCVSRPRRGGPTSRRSGSSGRLR